MDQALHDLNNQKGSILVVLLLGLLNLADVC